MKSMVVFSVVLKNTLNMYYRCKLNLIHLREVSASFRNMFPIGIFLAANH